MPADFKSEYSKLNAEQKAAINYIEGPLLVIAGPGTGKTQLLSLRAANILNKTDALPENILCLTFTESGAQEMRRRLISIIGEDAYKITISTYHGFGNEIIRSYPEYFAGGQRLRPIAKLKKETIIRDLQKSLPFTSGLKDPEMVSSISDLTSKAKQAVLSPKDLEMVSGSNIAFIKQASDVTNPLTTELKSSLKNIASFKELVINSQNLKMPKDVEALGLLWNQELEEAIEEAEETKKSQALTKWKAKYLVKDDQDKLVAKGLNANQRLKEFATLYEKYAKRLKSDNLYDYDDMILMSIEALRSNNELRFNLQEKYLYIMLDEYQDTNQAQAELTYLLTNNVASEGKPNVMALGDDDQAIFAFQGAKHSNMLDFNLRYREVKKITLKNNYRSTQSLINLSSEVSSQIKERLTTLLEGVNKDFKAARSGPSKIDNLNFESEVNQYTWLAEDIKRSKAKDLAIISPEHIYLERASAYLTEHGIPISYERRENVLDDPLIGQVVTTLKLLVAINEQNSRTIDSLAPMVLNFDFWGLPTEAVWKISWQAHDNSTPWLKVMLETKATRTIALMLIKLAANSLIYRYDFIIDQIIGLSDIVINDPKTISTRSKFLEFYGSSDDLISYRLFQNLTIIRDEFKDFNLDNNHPLMTRDLVEFINELKSSNIKLTNDFAYGTTNAAVKLMTVHGSKGLEFDSVYLLSFVNEVWGPKSRGYSSLPLPPNLEYVRQGAYDADDEKLRLLYVALTRAKNRLVTLSYDLNAAAKPVTPLKYLELSPKSEVAKTKLLPLWQIDEGPIEIDTKLADLLKKRLENYALSPSDLKTFIDVRHEGPQNFYKSVLLKYKTPVSPRVDYGSAIHHTLDWLQQTLIATKKLPSENRLIDEFKRLLAAQRLPLSDFKHLLGQGSDALKAYFKENKSNFSIDDKSEVSFRNQGLVINKARINGQIDKLIIDKPNKSLTIVDFKTGRAYSRWDNQPKLYLYRHQLYFYKMLVEKSSAFKSYKVDGAKLDFVEPDKSTKELLSLDLNYDEDETERLIKLIDAVWKHIEELNFPSVTKYKPNLNGIKQFEEDLITGKI